MKKIISLLCCFVMLFTVGVFGACQPNTMGGYALTIAYDAGGYGTDWIENAITKFCAAEGLDRSQVYLEAEKGYTDTINDKLSTNTQIRDLIIGTGGTVQFWGAMGYLEPIDDVLESNLSTGVKIKDALLNPKTIDAGLYDGHYYGFPASASGAWGIYYNASMFEEKGWTVPTTFAELKTLCAKIYRDCVSDVENENDRIYPFVCSSDINNYWDFVVMNWVVQLMGIDAYNEYIRFDKEESRGNFTAETVYAQAKQGALEAWKEIAIDNEHWIVTNSSDFLAAQMLFAQGKIAMMPNGDWFEKEVSSSLPEDMNIAIMKTPYLENAKTDEDGNPIDVNFSGGGSGWIIPKAASNKPMAKKFLKFMAEEEQCREKFLLSGQMSAFTCDYTAILDEMTYCQKSVYEMTKNAENFSFITTSPLAIANKATFWMDGAGVPYGRMLYNGLTPAGYINSEANYIAREWNNLWDLID